MPSHLNKPNRKKRFYDDQGVEINAKLKKMGAAYPTTLNEDTLETIDKWSDELDSQTASMVSKAVSTYKPKTKKPPKLTQQILFAIAKNMARYSMSLEASASCEGVSKKTLYEWIDSIEGLGDALARAREIGQKDLIRALLNHDQLSERGIMFALERRHRKDWGNHTSLEVSGQLNHIHITPEQSQQLTQSWQAFEQRNKQVIDTQVTRIEDVKPETRAD